MGKNNDSGITIKDYTSKKSSKSKEKSISTKNSLYSNIEIYAPKNLSMSNISSDAFIYKNMSHTMSKSQSQVFQDLFVLIMTQQKKNGFFIEIGSGDYRHINNTYLLEKDYNWSGLMFEYDSKYLNDYKMNRKNSKYIISDATKINFDQKFKEFNVPRNIDYLQIDLEVSNRSTLTVLENLNKQVMDKYKFAVITFEHDYYRGNFFETRKKSREIFKSRGYVLVFEDVLARENGVCPFEDWYIYPNLINLININ